MEYGNVRKRWQKEIISDLNALRRWGFDSLSSRGLSWKRVSEKLEFCNLRTAHNTNNEG